MTVDRDKSERIPLNETFNTRQEGTGFPRLTVFQVRINIADFFFNLRGLFLHGEILGQMGKNTYSEQLFSTILNILSLLFQIDTSSEWPRHSTGEAPSHPSRGRNRRRGLERAAPEVELC